MGLSLLASPSQAWLVFGAGGNQGAKETSSKQGREPAELCPLVSGLLHRGLLSTLYPQGSTLGKRFGRVVKTLDSAIQQICIQNPALLVLASPSDKPFSPSGSQANDTYFLGLL